MSAKFQDTIHTIEEKIGYSFKSPALLERALTHRSYLNEHGDCEVDNQRLEFLGDAVLSLIIAQSLFKQFPTQTEGPLSAMRASLVNDANLAKISKKLNLGNYIRLGQGELNSGGHLKTSILADSYEALVAAVYLDRGLEAARGLVLSHFAKQIEGADPKKDSPMDFKSQFQRVAQKVQAQFPTYQIVSKEGPPHCPTFVARVFVGNEAIADGSGQSKKAAEQDAAKKALLAYKIKYPVIGVNFD